MEEIQHNIEKFWQEYEGEFSGDIFAAQVVRLSKHFIRKDVLDIGAGSGALLELLPEAIGLDIAPKHPRVRRGDISQMPFCDESFDTIFATEVLEHLDNSVLENGLKEVRRTLRAEGAFVITTPYREDLKSSMVICPHCGERFHRWGHRQSFDEARMQRILESNGFTIVVIKYLPLGFLARYPAARYFWRAIHRIRNFRSMNLFVIARRSTEQKE